MVAAAAVLLPLYIWPKGPSGENTWQPVLDSAAAYPSLQFTVIVNPNSGPGDWPNPDYAAAIAQLNALSNVQTVGYVDTAQVNVPGGPYTIERIGNDIATYAARSRDESNVNLQGIFFDDVDNVYSDSVELLLEEAVNQTKAAEGLGNPRTVSTTQHAISPRRRVLMNALLDHYQPRYSAQLRYTQCRHFPIV